MSNFSKFKSGDKVKTIHGSKAKILRTWKTVSGDFKAEIEMESGFKYEYDEKDLKFYHEDIEQYKRIDEKYIGDKCPNCDTPWTKTAFGAKTWYDCIPCKAKAEDLLSYSPPDVPKDAKKAYDPDALFEELSQMLDDDDFGIPF